MGTSRVDGVGALHAIAAIASTHRDPTQALEPQHAGPVARSALGGLFAALRLPGGRAPPGSPLAAVEACDAALERRVAGLHRRERAARRRAAPGQAQRREEAPERRARDGARVLRLQRLRGIAVSRGDGGDGV